MPDKFEPVTVPVATTLVGVIAPNDNVIAGVVVELATTPLKPLAVITDTDVTDPFESPVMLETGIVVE